MSSPWAILSCNTTAMLSSNINTIFIGFYSTEYCSIMKMSDVRNIVVQHYCNYYNINTLCPVVLKCIIPTVKILPRTAQQNCCNVPENSFNIAAI